MASKVIAVKVVEGSQILLDWYALAVDVKETFASLYEKVITASEKGTPGCRFKRPIVLKETTYSKCVILTSSDEIEAGWGLKVKDTLESFDSSRVSFEIHSQAEPASLKNAFTELFQAQKKLPETLRYPSTFGEDVNTVKRGDWRLKNDIIKLLKDNQMGFTSGEETTGKSIVNGIGDCLFYIFPHLSKLSERSITVPDFFTKFFDRQTFEQDYNDPSKYKHKVKPLSQDILSTHTQSLFRVLTYPCMETKRMKVLKEAVLCLANSLCKHSDYMDSQRKRVLDIHNMPNPVRSPGDGIHTRLKHIPGGPRTQTVSDRYHAIEIALSETDDFKAISLAEFYPIDRKKRYHYLSNIQLSFDITYYHYSSGGPYEDLFFVWKCPNTLDLQRSNKIIKEIEESIPVYHSRAMRREFRERFSLVAKLSPSVLDEMYRNLTDDMSVPSSKVSKDVRQRLIALIDTQSPDIVHDMRLLRENKSAQFDTFFSEVETYLHEYELKAVDDRRHGLISHIAVAMSVRDFHQQICARLPPGTLCPSVDYLRLQFMPKNENLETAVRYTGRFPLKFKIQSRQFNMHHIDAHYASALQKYLKHFSVKFRDHCTLMSVDDKNHIPVGEPGVPIATVFRGKKSLAHSGIQNLAADHDTSAKLKLTPSVALQIEIPECVTGDFYNGQVSVGLKDTIFQPSTPLRHVAEMSSFLHKTGTADKPIRLIYSDGGPDHRITYPSVKLALIAMFIHDDLDYLLAMRTAPHQSYRNWVERIMSILNLSLQTVAIERSKMSDDNEKVLKNLGTMNSIRQKSEQCAELKDALQSSIDPVLATLNILFSRLRLKDKPFMVGDPASDTDIDALWNSMKEVDATVERTDTQAKQLKSKTKLQDFLTHCTLSRKYFFLVKKCGNQDCDICKPPRLETEVFKLLKDFPDPEPSSSDLSKFKDFDDVYGTATSERFCPSLTQMLATSPEGCSLKMTGETIRDYIECVDCGKPRCIYSAKKLSIGDKTDLDVLKEEVVYTCGSNVVPSDHPLSDIVIFQPNVTCLAPVAAHYYSARAGFPLVCFNCGCKEVLDISIELKVRFQTVHPVCNDCREKSIKERTRGEKKIRK